jgi:hypothetical protein
MRPPILVRECQANTRGRRKKQLKIRVTSDQNHLVFMRSSKHKRRQEVFLKYFSVSAFAATCWLTVFPVAAAPPASCANKFVGSWTVRVDSTGQTYPALILPNGRTQVTCPMCTPGGSWTCADDTITVNIDNGAVAQHRLHADGKVMSGGCCTLTRSGAAPVVSSESRSKPSSRLRLPGALSLLTPETAKADDDGGTD